MRMLTAAYCLFLLGTAFAAAWKATDALTYLFLAEFTKAHPLVASIVYGVIFLLLFVKGVILSMRHPATGILIVAFALITGAILLTFHFWY